MERSWELMERDAVRKDDLVEFLEQYMHPEGSDPEEIADALLSDSGLEALGFVGEWGYGYISNDAEEGFNGTLDLDNAIYGAQRKPEITGDKVIRRWFRREYFEVDGADIKKARDNRKAKAEADRIRNEMRNQIERDRQDALVEVEAQYQAKLDELS